MRKKAQMKSGMGPIEALSYKRAPQHYHPTPTLGEGENKTPIRTALESKEVLSYKKAPQNSGLGPLEAPLPLL
jgi:hypothetical protein